MKVEERVQRLLERIAVAFAGIPRPAITQSLARGYDDEWELSLERERELAARDPEQDWKEVTDQSIEAFQEYFNFSDPEGRRFYLPAYMSRELREFPENGYPAVYEACTRPDRFELLTPEQIACVEEFLDVEVLSSLISKLRCLIQGSPSLAHLDLYDPIWQVRPVPGRFDLKLPSGWIPKEEKSASAYTRGAAGSGILRISLLPRFHHPALPGDEFEQEFAGLIEAAIRLEKRGKVNAITHGHAAAGLMIVADCESENSGRFHCWAIRSEATVFATYTGGNDLVSSREIHEGHAAIRKAQFVPQ